jgi:hypothetical protein
VSLSIVHWLDPTQRGTGIELLIGVIFGTCSGCLCEVVRAVSPIFREGPHVSRSARTFVVMFVFPIMCYVHFEIGIFVSVLTLEPLLCNELVQPISRDEYAILRDRGALVFALSVSAILVLLMQLQRRRQAPPPAISVYWKK